MNFHYILQSFFFFFMSVYKHKSQAKIIDSLDYTAFVLGNLGRRDLGEILNIFFVCLEENREVVKICRSIIILCFLSL